MLAYSVPEEDAGQFLEVKVYDMLAREVATLDASPRPAGRYTVRFDGSRLPAGSYIAAVHLQNHMQSELIELTK
jgi:hypothetical protein